MSRDEYTREFEKFLIKCDIHVPEEQPTIRYLGGLDPRYANIIKLQQYTMFREVCILAHKVEEQRRLNLTKETFQDLELRTNLLTREIHFEPHA